MFVVITFRHQLGSRAKLRCVAILLQNDFELVVSAGELLVLTDPKPSSFCNNFPNLSPTALDGGKLVKRRVKRSRLLLGSGRSPESDGHGSPVLSPALRSVRPLVWPRSVVAPSP